MPDSLITAVVADIGPFCGMVYFAAAASFQGKMDMSDALQALLDSGALYLALGAFLCVVLGVGAARRLFQGAKKIETPRRRKD
jgi:hypothetical protein